MREILFRGKRADNGEWCEGQLLIWGNGEAEICVAVPENDEAMLKHTVDRETVGQYTGLNDMNGKKIFEGDILISAWKTKTIIYYDKCGLQFRARKVSNYGRNNSIDYYNNGKMEVIGNIYDNPELLGGAHNG